MLPREIREAPVVQPLSATEMLACVAEPFECPQCGVARAFFVLTKVDLFGDWTYACVICSAKLPAGQHDGDQPHARV